MWRLASISILGLCVGSCGTIPAGSVGPAVSAAQIVEAVRCQFASAFSGTPDPAGMIDWKALATITLNNDTGYEIHPGFAGVAGKAGKATWKAPASGMGFVGTTKRKIETEYRMPVIRAEIDKGPCTHWAIGLDIASSWLRPAVSGAPTIASGAVPKLSSYTNTFTVSASAGGGVTFAFADFSLSLEGNKASASRVYTIDVRVGPQTGSNAPFVSPAFSEELGLNADGDLDDFSDLRRDREKDEEDETVIKVPPGVPITIGNP